MKKSYLITALAILGAGLVALVLGLTMPYLLEDTLDHIGVSNYTISLFTADYGVWCILAHLGGAVVLSVSFALIFRKTVVNHCTRTTSLLAFALSVMGSAGLVCALLAGATIYRDLARYPYAHPTAIGAGVICLFACLILLGVYFVKWSQTGTWKGLLIDSLLTVIYFPAFFWLWNTLSHALWDLLKDVI